MRFRSFLGAVAVPAVLLSVACSASAEPDFRSDERHDRTIRDLLAGADDLTLTEAGALTKFLGGDAVQIVFEPKGVRLVGSAVGVAMSAGRSISNDGMQDGVWWVSDGGWLIGTDNLPIRLDAGTVILAGGVAIDDETAMDTSGTVSISCPAGYYACCGRNHLGQLKARCIANGQSPPQGDASYPTTCDAGGEPSTSCTFTGGNILGLEPPDVPVIP